MDILIVNHGGYRCVKNRPGPGKGGKTVPSHEPKLGYNGMIARKGARWVKMGQDGSRKIQGHPIGYASNYPLVNIQKAMENGYL